MTIINKVIPEVIKSAGQIAKTDFNGVFTKNLSELHVKKLPILKADEFLKETGIELSGKSKVGDKFMRKIFPEPLRKLLGDSDTIEFKAKHNKKGRFSILGFVAKKEGKQVSKGAISLTDGGSENAVLKTHIVSGKKAVVAVTTKSASKKVEETAAKPLKDTTAKATETLNNPKTLEELAKETLKAGKKTFERERIDYNGRKILETFDSKTKKLLKCTYFSDAGKTLFRICDYDPKTGNLLKMTDFYENGKISIIDDLHPETEALVKTTNFYKDGKTRRILEYDGSRASKALKATDFKKDGKIWRITDFDPETEKVIKRTRFDQDGKAIKQ